MSPIVTVRGEAQQEVAADRATLSVTAHATGTDADRVRSVLAAASQQVNDLAAPHRAAIESLSTSHLSVAPIYEQRRGTRVTGYRGTFSSTLVVHDFDALSALVLAFAALPDAEVQGPWWSLRPGHPAHREVRLAAIVAARRRAEDYAAAFGAHLAGLVEVSDLEVGGGGAREFGAYAMAADGGGPAFDLQPAPQTVYGQVTARFSLSEVTLD